MGYLFCDILISEEFLCNKWYKILKFIIADFDSLRNTWWFSVCHGKCNGWSNNYSMPQSHLGTAYTLDSMPFFIDLLPMFFL